MCVLFGFEVRYHWLQFAMLPLCCVSNICLRYLFMSVGFMFGVRIRGILFAVFAVLSASSLPVIPVCPGIHINFILGARERIWDLMLFG